MKEQTKEIIDQIALKSFHHFGCMPIYIAFVKRHTKFSIKKIELTIFCNVECKKSKPMRTNAIE